MELTTRRTHNFIEIKVDEIENTIFKNGNESNEFITNLLEVIEDICKLRDESIFEYLERFYDIEIKTEN